MPVICSPLFSQEDSDTFAPHFSSFGENFQLSDFQKHAIKAIVEGHHVLVCAPTGSGKTLPAEFAIRHFIQKNRGKRTRVIYTSPIKALSNQKYHEFTRKFPDISVGLCTGDIKTNPSADLLIMTAEILNNRLFQFTARSTQEIVTGIPEFTARSPISACASIVTGIPEHLFGNIAPFILHQSNQN